MDETEIWRNIIASTNAGDTPSIDFDEQIYRYRQTRTLLRLDQLTVDDITWKLLARKEYAPFFRWFLIIQNFLIFLFVFIAYYNSLSLDNLTSFFKLQPVFSIIIGGTIAQTVLIIRIMVLWIFSNTPYEMPASIHRPKNIKKHE